MVLYPEVDAHYTHEACLTESARNHIWGEGGNKFKAGRLRNVSDSAWKHFKDSCEAAHKARQKKGGKGQPKQGASGRARKEARASTLTLCTKSKKAARKEAELGRAIFDM